jgi:hypothetical protein
MPITRSSILRGPAVIIFGGSTFYAKDDIQLDMSLGTFDVVTSMHGKVDERVSSRFSKIRFTPAGEWEALSVLWPYGSSNIGDSVFGGTDVPLVIQTRDGKRLTFSAAAVTQMPDIDLSAGRTLIGPVEITAIGADNTDWTGATSLVAVSSIAFSDTTFASANIKTQPYTAAWGGSSPWSSFVSMDGFKVNFDLSLADVETDSDGLVDKTISNLGVRCRCRPMGITEAQLISALGLQSTGNSRGRSLNAGSNSLVITGTGVSVTLAGAQMKGGGMQFGPQTPRIGEVEFVATRTFSSGVANALFTLS